MLYVMKNNFLKLLEIFGLTLNFLRARAEVFVRFCGLDTINLATKGTPDLHKYSFDRMKEMSDFIGSLLRLALLTLITNAVVRFYRALDSTDGLSIKILVSTAAIILATIGAAFTFRILMYVGVVLFPRWSQQAYRQSSRHPMFEAFRYSLRELVIMIVVAFGALSLIVTSNLVAGFLWGRLEPPNLEPTDATPPALPQVDIDREPPSPVPNFR